MRLWSIHPKYLDSKGLVAVWREALLAKKVLQGKTKGYRNHPQLQRFRECNDPVGAINSYLSGVRAESCRRGYCFDRRKIGKPGRAWLSVTAGQLEHESRHLLSKLRTRDKALYRRLQGLKKLEAHSLFKVRKGSIEPWERI